MNDRHEEGSAPWGDPGPDTVNPYAAPEASAAGPRIDQADPGLVWHVLPVSILMIVQGVLELLLAIMLFILMAFVPFMMKQAAERGPEPPIMMLIVLYGVIGGASLAVGGLHLVAGIAGLRLRGRVLGIVALASGIATVFTCYCAPTGIALAIYGLITYLNPRVKEAFAMVEGGMAPADVRAHFRC